MQPPTETSPAATYYRRNAGRWRGRLEVQPVAGAGVQALRSRWLGALVRRWGVQLETLVDPAGLAASPPVVRHETVVRVAGIVVLETVEWFWVDVDGAGAEIRGDHRSPLLPGLSWPYTGSRLRVDPGGDGASYTFAVARLRWTQRARCDGEAVDLTVTTPWASAALRLERRPP